MKKLLFSLCLVLVFAPMTASALWWNPFTWKIFQRQEPVAQTEVAIEKKSEDKINELQRQLDDLKKLQASSTSAAVPAPQTLETKREDKNTTPIVIPAVKKVVKQSAPVLEKNNEFEPVYENIFTSDGYIKINVDEYNKFSSDNGQNVVFVNKKNGGRVVPKSTQNYLDAQLQKQQEIESLQYKTNSNNNNIITPQITQISPCKSYKSEYSMGEAELKSTEIKFDKQIFELNESYRGQGMVGTPWELVHLREDKNKAISSISLKLEELLKKITLECSSD